MHRIGPIGTPVGNVSTTVQPAQGPTPISDNTEIASETSHPIQFRLTGPGPVTVHSVPTPHPGHSETGNLGWVSILRPGGGPPAAHTVGQLADAFLGTEYTATAADVALPGFWTAAVYNGTLESATWATVIGGNVAAPPVRPTASASFDVELFNLIVDEVMKVAAISVHLQSDGGTELLSYVSWSPALAARLGKPSVAFHVADPQSSVGIPGTGDTVPVSFRIHGLDSDPSTISLILGGETPILKVTIGFRPAQLEGLNGTPDLDIASLSLELDIGFDGQITASCTAGASTLDGLKDESDTVSAAMGAQVTSQLHATEGDFAKYTDPYAVQANLEMFFSRLMHLRPGSKIKDVRFDGGSFVVDYYPPPTIPGPIVAHPVGALLGGS